MASLNSFAGASEENARSAGVIDAELRLESGTWRLVARELEHARMNLEVDSIDVLSLERMGGSELCAAVDARVNDDPAGERLVRVERDLEARSDGCDATNPAGMRITGGASVSAATIVLCVMRDSRQRMRRSPTLNRRSSDYRSTRVQLAAWETPCQTLNGTTATPKRRRWKVMTASATTVPPTAARMSCFTMGSNDLTAPRAIAETRSMTA